jgi:hypothetical protein
MTRHDDLLRRGPHEAPEPETAEQRSKRLGMRTAGGAVVGGGVLAAKLGGFSKLLLWLVLWHGVSNGWRVGGWIGIAAIVALGVTAYLFLRGRQQA